jgi:hypothetical protein
MPHRVVDCADLSLQVAEQIKLVRGESFGLFLGRTYLDGSLRFVAHRRCWFAAISRYGLGYRTINLYQRTFMPRMEQGRTMTATAIRGRLEGRTPCVEVDNHERARPSPSGDVPRPSGSP